MTKRRFCEECGSPLTPGVKFCEECGAVVTPGPPVPSVPGVSVRDGYPEPETPLAVVPFGFQPRGVLSSDRCTLVIYPGQVILAYVPKDREKEFKDADNEVEKIIGGDGHDGTRFWEQVSPVAGILRPSFIPQGWNAAGIPGDRGTILRYRPWERYLSMAPAAVLAEDTRNRAITRGSISYVRGEGEGGIIIISSRTGAIHVFFDHGIYSFARLALFSFLHPGDGREEQIAGTIAWAAEPQVEDFNFQFTWVLVVTDQRVWFCTVDEDTGEEMDAWIEAKKKEAKRGGKMLRDGDLAGMPDAPWQAYMKGPISSFLEFNANFFIPLDAIRSVKVVPGTSGETDRVSFDLVGETYTVEFAEGTAGHARAVLGPVLGEKLQ